MLRYLKLECDFENGIFMKTVVERITPTEDDLLGANIKEDQSFSSLNRHWVWTPRGELGQIVEYVKKEYWGERVFEVKLYKEMWCYDHHETALKILDPLVASWLMETYSKEALKNVGVSLMEKRALNQSMTENALVTNCGSKNNTRL